MPEPYPPPDSKRKPSFVSTLIEWLVATLIAAGAGAAIAARNPAPPEHPLADKTPPGKLSPEIASSQKPKAAPVCAQGAASLIDMPPIVTNVGSPSDTWVRLEASIVFDPKTLAHPEVVAAEIATDELAYLHTVSVSELQGPIGLENIRQDLRDRAFVRSAGKVTDLLLKTLVLQ
jgi:flagellar protein FliL